jgi:myosin heavy chain 9/10/11/14
VSETRKVTENRLHEAERRIRVLETKLDEDGRESLKLDELQRSLREELEDERKQHEKDLAERDFTTDQTRKKYQGMGIDANYVGDAQLSSQAS